jgi:hypothetical protein
MAQAKKVAAIVTDYRRHTHADVIAGKIIEGYNYDGDGGPNLRLASLYVDQAPHDDPHLPIDLAWQYGFTLYDTIADTLTLGGSQLAVDGVLCIAEHGKYPVNAQGQTLYPKRPFFEEVFQVFEQSHQVVPVFNSKHLATTWDDAKWIYDQAKALSVPLLAGSVLPLTWRNPPLALPLNSPLTEALVVYYGPLEGYGFHALETLQCLAERRPGGETGVAAVQCVQGAALWPAFDQLRWADALLDAALAVEPYHSRDDVRVVTADPATDAALFLIEYLDGFRAAVALLTGWVFAGDDSAMVFSGRLRGQNQPVTTQFVMQPTPPYGHFTALVQAIESLVQNGQAPYPVERTLLTTGLLDALLTSRAQGGQRLTTPQLAIGYQPVDWPFLTGPMPPPLRWTATGAPVILAS